MSVLAAPRDVFQWLDQVRARPSMFIRDVEDLETMIYGYETALHVHGVDERVPRFGLTFLAWVQMRRRWSMSTGWARAVRLHANRQTPLELFFSLVDEYRQLKPQVVSVARLTARNRAVAKTRNLREVKIIQYAPDNLFLLRSCSPTGFDEHVLFDNGRDDTSVAFAKRQAQRQFGVTASQWRDVRRATTVRRGTSGAGRSPAPSSR